MRGVIGCLTIIAAVVQINSATVHAIDTVPSAPPATDGDLIITSYSFSGHTLRYVQIYNDSNSMISLNGWKVALEWNPGVWTSNELIGLLPAKSRVIMADPVAVTSPTFELAGLDEPNDPMAKTVKLIAPLDSNLNDHVVNITINASTVNVPTIPATYYFSRNISSSTGNYLSTFSAFVPDGSFTLEQDNLYEPLINSPIQIVEVYPDATTCAPNNTDALCYDYVKLFNASTNPVDLSLLRIRAGTAGQSATASNTSYPAGILGPGEYSIAQLNLTDGGSWVWVEDEYGIQRYDETISAYPSASGHTGWAYSYNSASNIWQWTKFPTPYNKPNQFASLGLVNECVGLQLSEIGANYNPQFIEVINATKKPINISGCQLQTNRSQTKSYVFPEKTSLAGGASLAIDIAKTELSLTKTTSGTVYILNSDGTIEVDARSYEDLNENTSYALVGGKWVQTFTVTPSGENSYAEYPPCEDGYIRNIESGRCNKIPTEPELKPCLPTQYRSPETNRCRNIASATSALTPCKPGQFRNPLTNRCKSSTSTASSLKPCAPNQERNPETNRCRNKVKLINADFPVEAVAGAGQGTLGWWAFGGVGMIAVGYAGWEWRREVSGFIRKAASFIPLGK